jgi:RHS repeat-associated protein
MTKDDQTNAPDKGKASSPTISLPKGGGAISGIGEKFATNPVNGTGTLTVPIAVSPGRAGFGPQLALTYDSGAGNGPFGLGWNLSLPSITRKTDKGLPQYQDAAESDVFILSGAEDLVPLLVENNGQWTHEVVRSHILYGQKYDIYRYRPRVEGLFARIERWVNQEHPQDTFWRSISKDNVTTFYGRTPASRVYDPSDSRRVFTWLICESHDDKGNGITYEYAAEDSSNIDLSKANERNRTRSANCYLKRIRYGNTPSLLVPPEITQLSWLFEVVFDYGEGHYAEQPADPQERVFATASPTGAQKWPARQDPFSRYRAGFEVRTYRLCRRVLMFHHFPNELGAPDYLVRATEFAYRETPIASFVTGVTQSGFVRQSNGTYLKRSLPPLEFKYSEAQVLQKAEAQALQNGQAQVQLDINDVDADSLANLPASVDGTSYQWLDLDGEGLRSVLAEQDDGWYYKRNVSPVSFHFVGDQPTVSARFEPLTDVTRLPAFAELTTPRHQFMDLAGDGQLDCVVLDRPIAGFFKRTQEEDWDTFKPLPSAPNVDWGNANLRMLDVDGDGHADILITEDEALTWYPSLAEAGFGAPIRVPKARNEEDGPAIVFADSTQSIFLADMSGDGLTDIVRIRNGEVCYWPNLGYGQFGRKVTMDQSPWFDTPDQFDPRRIRLADTDGSGVTDIIYLARDGVRLYFNQSGNAWHAPVNISAFPAVDELSMVQALDLLGTGTACLVWMSSLPGDVSRSMRYIDLMGGQKPHLLLCSRNNLGAETHVFYAPSTKFYLADRAAGQPWATRLPFPVHVVERVETYDWVSRNRFVSCYAYHHGYYDGIEREFRGFGMVEQHDTEELGALSESGAFPKATNNDAAFYVPPVRTKTWFHTGAYPQGPRVSRVFEKEYYRESDLAEGEKGLTDAEFEAMLLPDTVLPHDLVGDEVREAIRSLKGVMLRQEIYALDDSPKAALPYTVSERNYTVKRLQPFGPNRHAVFFTHARESVDFHYERKLYDIGQRKLADPRMTHSMVLAVDDYGNELQSVAVAYGRRHDDPDTLLTDADRANQKKIHVTYTESTYTNPILEADAYRPPLPAEARTYELIKVTPDGTVQDVTNLFTFDELAGNDNIPGKVKQASDGAHDLLYEDVYATKATKNEPYRRLIEHVRTLYRKNDLTRLCPPGQLESLALPGETYKLAFTPGLLAQVFQRNGQALLPNPADVLPVDVPGGHSSDRGGYVDLDSNGHWWIPSGRIFLSPNSTDKAAEELTYARDHFFLPHRYRDPFHTDKVGTESHVTYDDYDLLVLETSDPLGNRVTVGERLPNGDLDHTKPGNDYRVLQPCLVMDPNRNRSAVAFDALGMVVGTAVMGKPEEKLGDSLDGFEADLTETTILDHLANPLADPHAILGPATTRLVYDLFAYQRTKTQPNPQSAVVYTLARETHAADLVGNQKTKIQHSFSYSDGFGREIQKKIQAEPGPVPKRDGNGKIIVGVDGQPEMTANDVDPRWVGNGWTVFNNKGKPVRQYEPFFTDTHHFEFEVKIGVSPVLFYDPVDRIVATLHPNHTWEKVVFDPWRQETWDVNDTVLVADPKNDADVSDFFRRLPDADYLPTWYVRRQGGALGAEEEDAARKAAVHAATPTVSHADSLARTFLTIAHNKFKYSNTALADPPGEEFYRTRVLLDTEGNQREVRDAIVQAGDQLGRVVMRYDYDMLSNRIHQASMEAGDRWMLNDVDGKPLYAWDSRDHQFRTAYDPLRRPTDSFLREGVAAELLVRRSVYGETELNPEANNLRGTVTQVFDQAGAVTTEQYDFKGNLLHSRRQLAQSYKTTLDWSAVVPLEAEAFTTRTRFDARNRPIQSIAPHSGQPGTTVNVIQPIYNEANLLEQVHAWLNQNAEPTGWLNPNTANLHAVTNIDYDAKGQRELIEYGNGASTTYEYDPKTFRLTHLKTTRASDHAVLQDLSYTYDPVGNIIYIRDDAQQTIYFNNKRVEPSADYTYDAVYRLIEATGREHLGQVGGTPIPHSYNDSPRVGLLHPGDGNAMGTYLERYVYDAVGNFQEMQHRATNAPKPGADPSNPGWTRTYSYKEASLLELGKQSNRLTSTTVGNGNPITEQYGYDAHGNMLKMPHLQIMQWDFKDQLQMTQRQAVNDDDMDGVQHQGERTYYVYDSAGQRVRKVTERFNGTRQKERIYLGGFEVYRERNGNGITVSLERETLHIMDDKQRIALVETRTQGNDPGPQQLTRYQLGNHLGSASLELDDQAQIISYEEYTPYGSTSYQAVRNQTEIPKRYRYTGKERDDETGLYYHGARYYAPWAAKWTSADPLTIYGNAEKLSPYAYVRGAPLQAVDLTGLADDEPQLTMPVGRSATEQQFSEGERASLRNESRGHPEERKVTTRPALPSSVGSRGGLSVASIDPTVEQQVGTGLARAATTIAPEVANLLVPGGLPHPGADRKLLSTPEGRKQLLHMVFQWWAFLDAYDDNKSKGATFAAGEGFLAATEALPFGEAAKNFYNASVKLEGGDLAGFTQHFSVGLFHYGKDVGETTMLVEGAVDGGGNTTGPQRTGGHTPPIQSSVETRPPEPQLPGNSWIRFSLSKDMADAFAIADERAADWPSNHLPALDKQWGSRFKNKPLSGRALGELPEHLEDPSYYREWTAYPGGIPGPRGLWRIVTGKSGEAYSTWTHYGSADPRFPFFRYR